MPVIVKLVVSFLLSGTVVVDISLSGLFDKLLSSGRSMHTVYLTDHGDINPITRPRHRHSSLIPSGSIFNTEAMSYFDV